MPAENHQECSGGNDLVFQEQTAPREGATYIALPLRLVE